MFNSTGKRKGLSFDDSVSFLRLPPRATPPLLSDLSDVLVDPALQSDLSRPATNPVSSVASSPLSFDESMSWLTGPSPRKVDPSVQATQSSARSLSLSDSGSSLPGNVLIRGRSATPEDARQVDSSPARIDDVDSDLGSKKRLVITYGNSKLGSIYFGKSRDSSREDVAPSRNSNRRAKSLSSPKSFNNAIAIELQTMADEAECKCTDVATGYEKKGQSSTDPLVRRAKSLSKSFKHTISNELKAMYELEQQMATAAAEIENMGSDSSDSGYEDLVKVRKVSSAKPASTALSGSVSDVKELHRPASLRSLDGTLTEQSVCFSGLEYHSTDDRRSQVVRGFLTKLQTGKGLITDLRKEWAHASLESEECDATSVDSLYPRGNGLISFFTIPHFAKERLMHEFRGLPLDPYTDYLDIIDSLKTSLESANLLPQCHGSINLLTNMPIDENLVATPRSDVTPSDKASMSELSILYLCSLLNTCPYINEDEKCGTVIQNVIPIPGKEHEVSGAGSLARFNWHTENVHETHPPEYLILLCLRGDKNAMTSFMLIEDIVSGLEKDFLSLLLTTPFLMKTGPSYHREKSTLRPILSYSKGEYSILYNSDINRCCPQDELGRALYQEFQDYLELSVPSYSICLEPGEAVVIKNTKALHKRDGFVISTADEERRWLQRAYLKDRQFLPHFKPSLAPLASPPLAVFTHELSEGVQSRDSLDRPRSRESLDRSSQ